MIPDHPDDAADGRRRLRSPSVTTRLLGLVLVSLIGLNVVTAGALRSRWTTAQGADDVHHAVDRVNRLVALRAALFQERAATDAIEAVRAAAMVPVEQASVFAGYDLLEKQRTTIAQTDATLGTLGEDADLLTTTELAAIRARSKATPGDTSEPGSFSAPYDSVEARLDAARNRILSEVEPELNMTGATRVADGLTAVRVELDVVAALVQELKVPSLLFMGFDPPRNMRLITTTQATEARAVTELRHLSDPGIAAAVVELDRDATTATYRANMEAAAAGSYPTVADRTTWRRLVEVNLAAMDHIGAWFRLIERSTAAVTATATELSSDATRELSAWIATIFAVAAGSLVVSVLLARSITRPLRRLHDHAAALTAGDVEIDPLPVAGPRDIAVTSHAFNDLVGNLRLLDAKTRALADLDFDAAALAEPLPGTLGRSLQRSATTLSGSITERDELRRHILHQASHDDLTGLPNRSAAIEELDQALNRAQRVGRGVAAMLVDIDDFKRINDTHGHTFGDRVLHNVARRLDRSAEGSSMVARVGGDEFLVIVEDLDDPEPATQLARLLTATLHEPVHVDLTHVTVSVSVGVAFSWDGRDQPDQLLAGADLAVARAKQRAPGTVELYDPALQEQLVEQAAVEEALTAALAAEDELFLQYQPVIDMATGRMTSVEALVRWNRPGVGIQPPDSFIPIAERSPLIIEIDQWVLARAARQLEEWRSHPLLARIDVAVNVSGRHLTRQQLLGHVQAMLDATRLDPRRLIVEITETALVDDLILAAAQLEGLRRLGVRIALDDFGTGYTSIAHLRQLPVDIIKIDRSFVQRLNSPTDRALLRMITDLGHQLGNTITAEGVETQDQYRLLRAVGCDRAQGYLMSRPLTPAKLDEWAAREQAVRAGRR